ncbi:MAG: DNA-formamidopyrimidine glycosylase family protein [Myxococcota bacterium]
MPEGDTIFRAARTLHRALAGKVVLGFESPLPQLRDAELVGARVSRVRPRGKNVLMELEDGRVLHSHLLMSGSWHIYRAEDRWRKPRRQMSVLLATDPWRAVGFDLPVAELLPRARASALLRSLGPDLLDPRVRIADVLPRLRRVDELPLGVALMRQHVVAGIGNVYKSEVLFLARLDPYAPVGEVGDEALLEVLRLARELMRRNLVGFARTTRKRWGGRLWVYGRGGEGCRVCGGRIRMRRQGDEGRSTYFCPTCQGVRARRAHLGGDTAMETRRRVRGDGS